MSNFVDFKGKKAIIYDEDSKKTLAETIILDFDRKSQTITVDNRAFNAEQYVHVSVLILNDDGLLEYHGTVRRMTEFGRMNIALYSGRHKEDRKSRRYDICTEAVVEHVVIGGRPVPLHAEREVKVINISSGGILIRGVSRLFNVGTTFQLRLPVAGDDLLFNATVVRTKYIDPRNSEFGCVLNFRCT